MLLRSFGLAAIACVLSVLKLGDGYRILAICPSPSISHQVPFRGLTLALNKRGHELVVVTADPVNDPTLKNYTEIDVSFGYGLWSSLNFIEDRGKMRWMESLQQIEENFWEYIDRILSQPDLSKLYAPDSNEKFDLLLVEMLYTPGIYPLATRFHVPFIGFVSLGPSINVHYEIGNPFSSHDPSIWELETELSKQFTFWQRLKNFFSLWRYLYWYRTTYVPGHQAIAERYFGNDIPDVKDIAKNVSLLLVNQQRAISYARPNVPKVIEIGGFHVSKKSTTMSKELQIILDGATEGFVYMSLGTNAKSTMMPNRTIEKFITAFSKLPYKVLWKFEDAVLPGKPDNVHIMKWIPQQAVLAHPNLKVFIYQGGVQSTEEAVHHAIPLVGFPVLGDQDVQVMKMASIGVAKKLEITAFDADELFDAISTVATDTSYKQRMLNLRSLIKDTPHDPLENAMWWIEHVIRHRGAPQLHSTTADQPWYSRQDMDIVAFIFTGFVLVVGLILVVSIKLVKRILKICTTKSVDAKKMN